MINDTDSELAYYRRTELRDEKINFIYNKIILPLMPSWKTVKNEKQKKILARAISNILRDMSSGPGFSTGYITRKALSSDSITQEHPVGCSKATVFVMNKLLKNPASYDSNSFNELLKEFFFTITTTKTENVLLKAFCKEHPKYNWKRAYMEVGIDVLYYNNSKNRAYARWDDGDDKRLPGGWLESGIPIQNVEIKIFEKYSNDWKYAWCADGKIHGLDS